MNVSVVIPTLNAAPWLERQLQALFSQTVAAEILIVDSSSTDETASIVAAHGDRVRMIRIPRERFDHGGTRDAALRKSCVGEFVVMLTQDAIPTDAHFLEALLASFADPNVAAVCGRQIAPSGSPAYDRLTRAFNYPEGERTWTEADIPRYGIKAYFFSNTCAAYRRAAYEAVGGFDAPVETNEDMLLAAKLLHAGYALSYTPEAAVWHSHRRTLKQEYLRNAAAGRAMMRYRERLVGANAGSEGLRLVFYATRTLLRQGRPAALPAFYIHAAARFIGYRAGVWAEKRKRKYMERTKVKGALRI